MSTYRQVATTECITQVLPSAPELDDDQRQPLTTILRWAETSRPQGERRLPDSMAGIGTREVGAA